LIKEYYRTLLHAIAFISFQLLLGVMNDPGPLKKALEDAVRRSTAGKEVAVAFSGGLDSGIIAALTKEYAKKATLYTVGSNGSHDVKEAKTTAEELDMRLFIISIEEKDVMEGLREMIRITGTKDPVMLSFELPLFYVCKYSIEKDVIGGQGADELFAGYSKYIGLEPAEMKKMISQDKKKLLESTIPHEMKVASYFGKKLHHPFLDEAVEKEAHFPDMISEDDPLLRKKILREVSEMMGYHALSSKEKKAAQYGSGAMAIIKKTCRNSNMTFAELIDSLCSEVT